MTLRYMWGLRQSRALRAQIRRQGKELYAVQELAIFVHIWDYCWWEGSRSVWLEPSGKRSQTNPRKDSPARSVICVG